MTPSYGTQNNYSQYNFQSAFLPSPKHKDIIDESSIWVRLNNLDEKLDISSGAESYLKNKNVRNFSENPTWASRYSNSFIQFNESQDNNAFSYEGKYTYKNRSKEPSKRDYERNEEIFKVIKLNNYICGDISNYHLPSICWFSIL